MKKLLIPAVLLSLITLPAVADFYDGLRAYDSGDYPKAAEEWKSDALTGNAQSIFRLGRLYETGQGILQDFIAAHALYNIAASKGDKRAAEARDTLAGKMTKQEQADARAKAKSWPSWLTSDSGKSAPPQQTAAKGVERFNGLWKWTAIPGDPMCSIVFGPPARVENGKFEARVMHGSDSALTSILGTISEDGAIRGYGTGMYSFVDTKGQMNGNEAKGAAKVSGEAYCTVEWEARRVSQ